MWFIRLSKTTPFVEEKWTLFNYIYVIRKLGSPESKSYSGFYSHLTHGSML